MLWKLYKNFYLKTISENFIKTFIWKKSLCSSDAPQAIFFAILGVFVLGRMHFSAGKVLCAHARARTLGNHPLRARIPTMHLHYTPRAPASLYYLKTPTLFWEKLDT